MQVTQLDAGDLAHQPAVIVGRADDILLIFEHVELGHLGVAVDDPDLRNSERCIEGQLLVGLIVGTTDLDDSVGWAFDVRLTYSDSRVSGSRSMRLGMR